MVVKAAYNIDCVPYHLVSTYIRIGLLFNKQLVQIMGKCVLTSRVRII
jgi:hypothetical protein